MIVIEERKTNKCPGLTSLFLTFPYSPDIVAAIKECENCFWDSEKKEWESPLTNLSKLLTNFSRIDAVTLKLLEEKEVSLQKITAVSNKKIKPFQHQLDAVSYGLSHDSWLLLDAPGLGKTLSMILLAEELKKREHLEHCLIICGVNCLKENWLKEIEKFSTLSGRILGSKINTKGKLVVGSMEERVNELKTKISEFFIVTNIETLRDDNIVKYINKGKNKFDMIVVDEVHVCKSTTSKQGSHLQKLKKAKHRIGLSGTVLVNDPVDVYAPLSWIGAETATLTDFKHYYYRYGGPFNNEFVGYKNISVIKDQLERVSLRRTKDLLNLPPKNIINEYVDMDSSQAQFYDEIKRGIKDQVDKVKLNTVSLLALIARLRQATTCPSALTTNNISCAKIDRCCDLAEQLISNDEKVVIFTTFKESVYEIQRRLSKYHPLIGTGDIDDDTIAKNIDKFQNDPSEKVFICTTAKMGTGLTLNAASYMIFVQCTFTRAQNLQCEDRIHRIGSKRPVFIYYLWTAHTIDERVKEIVENKAMISEYIVDDTCSPLLEQKLRDIIHDL